MAFPGKLSRRSCRALDGIGSDTQLLFARVIVGSLLGPLLLGFFVYPVLYRLVARDDDVLQV